MSKFSARTKISAGAASVIAVAGVTAACGSGSQPSAASAAPEALAARVHRTDWTPETPLLSRETVNCTMPSGQGAEFATFNSAEQEDSWIKVVSQVGGVIVKGNLWAASTESRADAKVVQSALGGPTCSRQPGSGL